MKLFTAMIVSIGLVAATPVMAQSSTSSSSSGSMQSPSSSTGGASGTVSSPSSTGSNMNNPGTANRSDTGVDSQSARQRYEATRKNCMSMDSNARAQCMKAADAMQQKNRGNGATPTQPTGSTERTVR